MKRFTKRYSVLFGRLCCVLAKKWQLDAKYNEKPLVDKWRKVMKKYGHKPLISCEK